ncbi:MAG: thioredoxin-like domain-containing protein [Thermoguttaceae bacterium]|jgi:tetratricopeptide (TPR) repeat protein
MKLIICTNKVLWLFILSAFIIFNVAMAYAATPTVEQALNLTPVQPGVDYDRPGPQEIPKCKILAKKINGQVGWIVEGPDGTILRKFVDTNGDNVVDQWSYYKDGIEVYRDIDSNFNGKADQHRWFNTGGTRWGLDPKEDGTIESWKSISAEEVTAEVVAALAARDQDRFARVLLASDELKNLGLGKSRSGELAEKVGKLSAAFKQLATRQKTVTAQTTWVQFTAGKPGVVPAGSDESTKDIRVYENVVAIVETAGKNSQLHIGTLVQVGDGWRAIDLPQEIAEGQADSAPAGFFFQASLVHRSDSAANAPGENSQKLMADLDKLDQTASAATTPEEQAKYTSRRADLLEQIAAATPNAEERAMWLRQLTDMIGAAGQMGAYPEAVDRLKALFEKLKKNEADKDLAAYVKFRLLMADYWRKMQDPKTNSAKVQAEIQTEWQKNLEQFLTDYPAAPDAAEVMLQLAIAQEFAGQDDEAKRWYARAAKEFPDSPAGKKALGAQSRLDCEGKTLSFTASGLSGKAVNLANFRGKIVLIQFWTTHSDQAKSDMAMLKDLIAKYGRSLTVIGVSVDNSRKELDAYLSSAKLTWTQVFEEGGLDSPPANQLGILTVPTMILVDQQGKVVNRNIQTAEIEAEVKKLLK